jgi:hypothetical protein
MSNRFQPWSEIEDETLLKELGENILINEIARNHKRTIGAINMRIGRIAYQLAVNSVDVDTIMEKTHLNPKQLYASIKKHSRPINNKPIPKDNSLKYTYVIIFHCHGQEILRENGVSYKLLSYCEGNCIKVVNSERIKKELGELLDGDTCFCDIRLLNNKNKVIMETINIKYPFKQPVDRDDLLNV